MDGSIWFGQLNPPEADEKRLRTDGALFDKLAQRNFPLESEGEVVLTFYEVLDVGGPVGRIVLEAPGLPRLLVQGTGIPDDDSPMFVSLGEAAKLAAALGLPLYTNLDE
jgi:hypothetical protein